MLNWLTLSNWVRIPVTLLPSLSGLVWSCPFELLQKFYGTSSSSSSCRAASTDIPDPLSTLLPIIHHFWQVFRATSRILTELLYVCSSWSSCFCLAICGDPSEYITDEFVLASPAMSCVSGSS